LHARTHTTQQEQRAPTAIFTPYKIATSKTTNECTPSIRHTFIQDGDRPHESSKDIYEHFEFHNQLEFNWPARLSMRMSDL
jgi:hypothetical protein